MYCKILINSLFLKVQIVSLDEETSEFTSKSTFDHPYPTTKIMWIPDAVSILYWYYFFSIISFFIELSSCDGDYIFFIYTEGRLSRFAGHQWGLPAGLEGQWKWISARVSPEQCKSRSIKESISGKKLNIFC